MDDPPTTEPTSIRDPFCADHRRLEELLDRVLQMLEVSASNEAAPVWGEFRDALTRHMHAEEVYVIPALTRIEPLEARVLHEEHRHLRRRCAELSAAMARGGVRPEVVRAFADELRAHVSHEVRTLYAWAETDLESSKHALAVACLGKWPPGTSR